MSEQIPSTELSGYYAWTHTLQGVYYGPGSVSMALPKLLDTFGASKAMVVTGNSLYTKTDVVKKVEGILREQNRYATTFHNIGEHSPISEIRAGVDTFKHLGYTDEVGQKTVLYSQYLAPSGIILDAELTLATPERLWLSTGIRGLDHAVENLYQPSMIPPTKHLCYSAIVDLFKYLPQSRADPNDVHARQKLQVASWMSLWPARNYREVVPIWLSSSLLYSSEENVGVGDVHCAVGLGEAWDDMLTSAEKQVEEASREVTLC